MVRPRINKTTILLRLALGLQVLLAAPSVLAWGDLGHEVVARIAQHYLTPEARRRVDALLADDTDTLTAHDMASVAVWADRFRDSPSNGPRVNYHHTHEWHFVDMDRRHPSLDRACHGHPPLPKGTLASDGPPNACVVDKIEQFAAELAAANGKKFTGEVVRPLSGAEVVRPLSGEKGSDHLSNTEQRVALKYLIHFVGDLHQPLHAINDHDRGGNEKRVRGAGIRAGSLHHAWDTTFVERLGPDSETIANHLIANITPANLKAWQRGTPRDWAMESFNTAKTAGYDALPTPDDSGRYYLSASYINEATEIVAIQLEEAGVRLAMLLNQVL
jgi:hypothetical protein